MGNDFMEYKGYRIRIERDTDSESPRTAWDNAGILACFHQKYNLGDEKTGFRSLESVLEYVLTTDAVWLPVFHHDGHFSSLSVDISEMVKTKFKFSEFYDASSHDVYEYDALILDGQCGVIYMDAASIIKEYGDDSQASRMMAIKQLQGEIESYNQYLSGEIYGYIIEKPTHCDACQHDDAEQVESCWGFYGETDCENEAKSIVDYLTKEKDIDGAGTLECAQY